MTSIKINSHNCRGIRDKKKRADIFLKAKEEGVNILCLQETHLKLEDLDTIRNEWNVDYYISGKDRNAGGTLIAIDNSFEQKCHEINTDIDGRYTIIDLELIGVARILLINLYAPNEDDPTFFNNLFDLIETFDTKNLIICGDWNLVMNYELDTFNYKKNNNPKAREVVLNNMEKLDLVDIWRQTHELGKGYTWRQNHYRKLARLDFFLISETLLDLYANTEIKPAYKSDHCPITLEIYISKSDKGKGIWKLNNSLLMDEELTLLINKEIELTVSIYACTPYHPNFVKTYTFEDIDLMIEIDLFWEVLQAQLRGVIINYASKKKKKQQKQEKQLLKEIEEDNKNIHLHINDTIWMDGFRKKEEDLEDIREYRLKGALVRARWQQLAEGEKPTKFFLNLENRNFVSKHIRELKVNDQTINNPKDILNEMKVFYENLYKERETPNIEEKGFNHVIENLTKLDDIDRNQVEKEITMAELETIVNKSKNNKSPGPDGFSNEFYKIFWNQIKLLLLKLLKYFRSKGELNERQLSGVITCIPKGGKLRNNLKNWRPITLLNSIYKFYSGILAERIKILLPKLINEDQKGFINGRFIGENTRLIYDIINACEQQNLSGLIILIDFEKAFDSISWEFISKSLEKFNFGENTIKWIKSLQKNSTSNILQNGHLSDKITLGRGCRQGDPISPYLFVLAAEFLAESIRLNKEIKGIHIREKEHKLSLYADDTTLFLKYEEESMRNCIWTLKAFEEISGLKINEEKTKVVKIGAIRDNKMKICSDLKLIWTEQFTALGITYDVTKMNEITEQNINIKMNEILKLIRLWGGRNITPIGKITIVKSLLISKIIHILLSLPTPKKDTFNKLENVFKEFIWNHKPAKFRKEILQSPLEWGGLKMMNLEIFDIALKLSWFKRLKNEKDGWEYFPRFYNIHKILIFGDKYPPKIIKNIDNKFWADVARASIMLHQKMNGMINNPYNISLWFNSGISISFNNNWYQKGYTKLIDILDINGDLLSREDMLERGLIINFLSYEKIRYDISLLPLIEKKSDMHGPYIPYMLFIIGFNMTGCAKIYNLLMDFDQNIIQQVQNKWEEILTEDISYQMVKKAFMDIGKMKEGPYTKYLQFKMLHRRIFTNKKLHNIGIIDSSKCPYCEEPEETIEHAFIYCETVNLFWKKIERWLQIYINGTIKICNIEKILGTGDPNNIVDKMIIATKRVIYKNRQTGKSYNIKEVHSLLRSQMLLEEYKSSLEGDDRIFMETWELIYGYIK